MYYYPSIHDFTTGKNFKGERLLAEFIEWVGKESVRIRIKGFYKNCINKVIVVRKRNCKDLPEDTASVKQIQLRNFYEVDREPAEVDPLMNI